MRFYTHAPTDPWAGGEVEKRAALFDLARYRGATPDDWLLILDGDMSVAKVAPDTRDRLAEATENVAEVTFENVRPDGHMSMRLPPFRSLFRALPGLTVKWTHYLYVAPLEVGWRYLWHTPHGHPSPEPALDLTEHVTLHHHFLDRTAERDAASREYYRRRGELKLERAPHY